MVLKNSPMNINSKKMGLLTISRSRGVMDKALDFKARHCGFEPRWGNLTIFFHWSLFFRKPPYFHMPLFLKNLSWHLIRHGTIYQISSAQPWNNLKRHPSVWSKAESPLTWLLDFLISCFNRAKNGVLAWHIHDYSYLEITGPVHQVHMHVVKRNF